MILTIELTPAQEARLRTEAAREGKEPAAVLAAWVDVLPSGAPASSETWGARKLTELRTKGALGVWKDRSEDSPTLAAEFQDLAEIRGPLPCD